MAHAIPIWMLLKTVQCCCLLWSQVRIRPHIAIAGSWAQVDMVERNNQSFNSLITTRFFFVFCLYHGAHIRLQVGSMDGGGKCGWGCGKTKSDSFCFIIIHWSLLGVWFDAVASILSFYPLRETNFLGEEERQTERKRRNCCMYSESHQAVLWMMAMVWEGFGSDGAVCSRNVRYLAA